MFSFLPIQRGLNLNHYTQEMEPTSKRGLGFTEFGLNQGHPHENQKPNQKYKMHLNFDDASFVMHRKAITQCIDDLGYLGVIIEFKYFDFSKDTLLYDPVYQEILRSIEKITAMKTITLEDSIVLKKLKFEKSSSERFIGQTQFTLSLSDSIAYEKLVAFCIALNDKLHTLGMKAGTVPNTDAVLTPYLSLRQNSLNNTNDRIDGVGIDPDEHAKKIDLLTKQTKESVIYKLLNEKLNSNLKAKAASTKAVSVIKKEINENKFKPGSSAIRLFGAHVKVATKKKTPPIAWYQEAENKFLQSDFKGAYQDYTGGYSALCELKILTEYENDLKRMFIDKLKMFDEDPKLKSVSTMQINPK